MKSIARQLFRAASPFTETPCVSSSSIAINCQRASFRALSDDSFSATAAPPRTPEEPANEPKYDTSYRSATERVWPATRQQKKFASRLQRSLATTLLEDTTLRDILVENLGFSIKEVRMAPDNAKAFILWDSYNGQAAKTERELKACLPYLKSEVAKRLGARNMPRLEFRLDKMSAEESEIEEILDRLALERRNSPT